MKKAISIFTALAAALSMGSSIASAQGNGNGDVSIFGNDQLECAKGQTVTIPIDISAGDDFESAQFELYYAKKVNGVLEKPQLEIVNVASTRSNLAVSWKDFKEDGYVNIVAYCSGKEAVKDGEILNLDVRISDTADLDEYELRLVPVLFATFKGGEQKIDERGLVISCANIIGDSNGDGKVNVRDAARLSVIISKGEEPPAWADFNGDGKVNVRDCAAVANACAKGLL